MNMAMEQAGAVGQPQSKRERESGTFEEELVGVEASPLAFRQVFITELEEAEPTSYSSLAMLTAEPVRALQRRW